MFVIIKIVQFATCVHVTDTMTYIHAARGQQSVTAFRPRYDVRGRTLRIASRQGVQQSSLTHSLQGRTQGSTDLDHPCIASLSRMEPPSLLQTGRNALLLSRYAALTERDHPCKGSSFPGSHTGALTQE